jgi:hypothetical protein
MHEAGPGEIQVSSELKALIGKYYALPIYGARAAWVRDRRLGRHAPPQLFINVGLYSEDTPTLMTTLNFSASGLGPESDLGNVRPIDLDPLVYAADYLEGNSPEVKLLEVVPTEHA